MRNCGEIVQKMLYNVGAGVAGDRTMIAEFTGEATEKLAGCR